MDRKCEVGDMIRSQKFAFGTHEHMGAQPVKKILVGEHTMMTIVDNDQKRAADVYVVTQTEAKGNTYRVTARKLGEGGTLDHATLPIFFNQNPSGPVGMGCIEPSEIELVGRRENLSA